MIQALLEQHEFAHANLQRAADEKTTWKCIHDTSEDELCKQRAAWWVNHWVHIEACHKATIEATQRALDGWAKAYPVVETEEGRVFAKEACEQLSWLYSEGGESAIIELANYLDVQYGKCEACDNDEPKSESGCAVCG